LHLPKHAGCHSSAHLSCRKYSGHIRATKYQIAQKNMTTMRGGILSIATCAPIISTTPTFGDESATNDDSVRQLQQLSIDDHVETKWRF
jgi:hypothetical protein